MKKVFSLLLVVAMLVSMAVVASAAPANQAGGMHTVITETDTDITVDIYLNNINYCGGFNSLLLTDAVTYVAGSAVLGDSFAVGKLTDTQNKAGQIKMIHTFSDLGQYVTNTGSLLALSYKVEKVNPDVELEEADFAMGATALTTSKVTTGTGGTIAGVEAGNNFTSQKQPAYFTIEYVDARAPIVPVPDFGFNLAGTTVDCYGKLSAEDIGKAYGVAFTKGDKTMKYHGAKPGETVNVDGNVTELVFDEWDGTFSIVLEGVSAGDKEFRFFVGDTYVEDAFSFTVE